LGIFTIFGEMSTLKKSVFILFVFFLVIFISGCKKSDDVVANASSLNYSSQSGNGANPGGPFSFTKITINPNPVKIGIASKLTATATGTNLTYTWTTSHGDLFGSGSVIYYSDSCIGDYSVTCVVSDGKQSITITVPISVSN
jgi:hypothetical protein